MDKAGMHKSERIYSYLLELYPKHFRQEFAEEMKFVFSESLKEASLEQRLITLWVRTILDAIQSIVKQHMENQKGRTPMKTEGADILMQNRVFVWIVAATGLILLIPYVAMQVTESVAWTRSDFVIAGGLLFSTGLLFVLAARRVHTTRGRMVVGVVVAAAFLYLWAELAVGIFTNWGS